MMRITMLMLVVRAEGRDLSAISLLRTVQEVCRGAPAALPSTRTDTVEVQIHPPSIRPPMWMVSICLR